MIAITSTIYRRCHFIIGRDEATRSSKLEFTPSKRASTDHQPPRIHYTHEPPEATYAYFWNQHTYTIAFKLWDGNWQVVCWIPGGALKGRGYVLSRPGATRDVQHIHITCPAVSVAVARWSWNGMVAYKANTRAEVGISITVGCGGLEAGSLGILSLPGVELARYHRYARRFLLGC